MSTSADLTEADIRRYAVPRLAAHIMKSDAKLGEEILNSNNSPYEFSKEGNDPDTYRIDNRVGAVRGMTYTMPRRTVPFFTLWAPRKAGLSSLA